MKKVSNNKMKNINGGELGNLDCLLVGVAFAGLSAFAGWGGIAVLGLSSAVGECWDV